MMNETNGVNGLVPHQEDKKPEGKELTPIRKKAEADGGAMAQWDGASALVRTSCTAEGPALRQLLSRALEPADVQTIDLNGKTIEITDFLAHAVELQNEETGELRSAVRVVLFCVDGTTVSTCSGPCVKALAHLSSMWGPGPFNPAIALQFTRRKGRGVFNYYTVKEVASPNAKVPTASAVGSEPKKHK